MNAHTHTHTHTQTRPPPPPPPNTHTPVAYQEEKVFKKRKFFKEDLRADRGIMADRNRELVPDNWSLVRERALTTGHFSEGWYSEHSGVCRRAELPGRCVKVKKF